MDFDIGENYRLAGALNHFVRFGERGAEAAPITSLVDIRWFIVRYSLNECQIARYFYVNRSFITQRGVENAVNFLKRSLRIAQDRRCDRELLEDLFLGIELADFVVEKRIFLALFHPGRAANDNYGGFFSKSFSRSVGDFQTAYAIGNADRAKTTDSGVGIGRKPGALLIARVNQLEFAFRKLVVESEDVIPRNAKDVAHTVSVEALDEVFADGRRACHIA
jgi:hypothetical protein